MSKKLNTPNAVPEKKTKRENLIHKEDLLDSLSFDDDETIKKLMKQPNMTMNDKKNMKKAIEYIKSQWLDYMITDILPKIRYSQDSINIWWVAFAKKEMAAPWELSFRGKAYYTKNWYEEADVLLEGKWMSIPTIDDIIEAISFIEWQDDTYLFSDENIENRNPKLPLLWILIWLKNEWSYNNQYWPREVNDTHRKWWWSMLFDYYWVLCSYDYDEELWFISIEADDCFAYPVRPILNNTTE